MTTANDSFTARVLGFLIFAPGVAFAIANSSASGVDADSSFDAAAAVVLSGAVGGAVAAKPGRTTYAVALGWSVFSVVFELMQAYKHQGHGSDGRMFISLGLGVVRLAGAIVSARQLRAGN